MTRMLGFKNKALSFWAGLQELMRIIIGDLKEGGSSYCFVFPFR
jgi:hypothetical protein